MQLDKDVVNDLMGNLMNHPVKQLDNFFELDFKALVQECNSLKKAAERKAFIEPYKPLLEAVRKAYKSNPQSYMAPSHPKKQLKDKRLRRGCLKTAHEGFRNNSRL